MSNPLLNFEGLPLFDAIRPEHVTPAIGTLLDRCKSVVAKLEAPMAEITWDNFVTPLDDCTEQQIEGFTGTFTNTASGLDTDTVHYWEFPYEVTMDVTDESGNVNTYTSPYYQYAEAGSLTYGVFIMGDHPLTVLKSASENAETGKKIAVIKESYGNAFVPYLTYNYEEVHVIDFRTFGDNLVSYCQQNGIDEVLFLNGVMSANTQIQLDSMSSLFD